DVTYNKELARGYNDMPNELRDATHIQQSVTLQDLMQFNDLFEARKEDEETRQQIWLLTKKATAEATQALVEMRRKEGGQLRDDLLGRIEHMDEMLAIVQSKTNGRSEKTKKELLERIHNLIESDKIDDDRLEMEVAMLADKMDITEEIVRTQSHLKYFKEAVNNEEAVGRRLNFLSQEINREINTIGSKANDSEISQYVVQAKESLEQIKEQIQNVEQSNTGQGSYYRCTERSRQNHTCPPLAGRPSEDKIFGIRHDAQPSRRRKKRPRLLFFDGR